IAAAVGVGRLAGYEDVNDAERLRHDPTMRWIVGGKAAHSSAASPSQMGRFETQWLAAPANLSALANLSGQWIDLVHGRRPPRGIVLDMDSSVSPTHGEQEMSVWNGHYACACYHPLFVFTRLSCIKFLSLMESVPGVATLDEMMSGFKYRAFISYSHRDAPWARWLHNALERYRVDRDLVGRATPAGSVPKTLRPIFRDRDEFSAG